MDEEPLKMGYAATGEKWGSLVPDVQPSIKNSQYQFRLEIIKTPKSFQRLLEGFTSMKAVTYVAKAQSLLDFHEKFGYSEVEIVLGESFTDFQNDINLEVFERLCSLVENHTLRIYVPKKTIHSKMYILEDATELRVIYGSRNLYPSSSWDSVAVFDVPKTNEIAKQFIDHYQDHREACTLYLGDLVDRLRAEPEKRQELIEAYHQQIVSDEGTGIQATFLKATSEALKNPSLETLTIELPKGTPAKKEVERVLKDLSPIKSGNQLVVRSQEYLGLVEKTIGLPVMVVDMEDLVLRIVIGGITKSRTNPPPSDPVEISRALEHIERYLSTSNVEMASDWDQDAQKAGMFECILYVLAAPFFHELMKIRRARFGLVDRRGPLFLMIYGRSSNGKTTFLQFALKLLAGESVSPLPGKDFKTTTLDRVRVIGTVFPLVFDDVSSVTDSKFGDIIKSYWEKRWNEGNPIPQLIFSTNAPIIKDWARTRVKKVVFPVYFQPSPAKKQVLQQLLLEDNPIFEWFSYLFLKKLKSDPDPNADDIALARQAFKDLYGLAQRQLPSYFPDKPVDQTYSTGQLEWHDLLYGIKKANIVSEGSRIKIEFTGDMQRDEVSYYESNLPLGLNKDRKGNTILIYSQNEFNLWLSQGKTRSSKNVEAIVEKSSPTLRKRLRSWFKKDS